MRHLPLLQLDSVLSYLIALLLPAFDAVLPILPAETAIVALGVATATSTDARIGVIVALAALGAALGDNLSYLVAHRYGPRVERRFFAGERSIRRRAWAERALERRGAQLILVCRFVPGGRTAVTITCGLLSYPRRRFIAATVLAGAIWASSAFLLGRLGGAAFEERPAAGLLVALGLAAALGLVVELCRRARHHAGKG
ncbi:MAG TPA: DedA family protein [Acidimicrobiales bacterium]|nr:DedA family protein [Acidimicrobiales bacterium]